MNNKEKRLLVTGIIFLIIFGVWTILVLTVDVQPAGQNGTDIGFAAINCSFHRMTGVHMTLYMVTDWLGLVPVAVCIAFAAFGFVQLVKR